MHSRRSLPTFLISIAATLLLPVFHAAALVNGAVYVFDSFGPGTTYSSVHWVVSGSSAPTFGYQAHAESFVPNVSGYLSQIQLATIVESGLPETDFTISLDNGSGIPGIALESFNNIIDPANGVLTLSSITTPLLQAGQKYWLTDRPVSTDTITGWYENNLGLTGNYAYANAGTSENWDNLGTAGNPDSAFSISVIPVPEPSTFGLMLLAFAAPVLRSLARRRIRPLRLLRRKINPAVHNVHAG